MLNLFLFLFKLIQNANETNRSPCKSNTQLRKYDTEANIQSYWIVPRELHKTVKSKLIAFFMFSQAVVSQLQYHRTTLSNLLNPSATLLYHISISCQSHPHPKALMSLSVILLDTIHKTLWRNSDTLLLQAKSSFTMVLISP